MLDNGAVVRTILGGDAKQEQAEISDTDEVTVLLSDGTYVEQTGGTFSSEAEYAVKWIQRASAIIGGKEVAVETKRESILSLNKRLDRETDADKRQAILDQIAATEAGIQELYEGTEEAEGLYALMRRAAQLTVQRAGIDALYQTSMLDQEEIEQRFAVAMGDMLRDGYWSNTAYAPGQENLLYLEAAEIMDT